MKIRPMIAAAVLLLSCSSCSSTSGTNEKPAVQATKPTEAETEPATEKPTRKPRAETEDTYKVRNYMTPDEKRSVSIHGLTLLDSGETEHSLVIEVAEAEEEPTEKPTEAPTEKPTEKPAEAAEETEEETEAGTEPETEADEEDAEEATEEPTEPAKNYRPVSAAIDGCLYRGVIPPLDYVSGEFTAVLTNDEGEPEEKTFSGLDSYLEYERQKSEKRGESSVQTDSLMKQIRFVFDSVKSGSYETVPEGRADWYDCTDDPFADYRSSWRTDAGRIEQIKDSVQEIEVYDEKMDRHFLVEVTLPPEYDEKKTYPVLLLTDAVFWFNNVPDLYQQMQQGETEEVIIAALGYDYGTDAASDEVRVNDLVTRRADMHDFIVNNLMPLLGETYSIDYTRSTLFGHSCGGLLTHYALFNEELYENQVFGNYVIASPVFWALDLEGVDPYPEKAKEDYFFFDTHDKVEPKIWLCAGADEDPDYQEYYNGGDTTVEGTEKLRSRLEEHGADVTYKLYPSHHDQYVPSMLREMMKEFYPPKA